MTVVSILQMFGLSITKSRINLLSAFMEANIPLTVSLLLKKKMGLDRATLHRTLKIFVKKEIIYIIPSTNTKIIYQLRMSVLNNASNPGIGHLHFICNACSSTLNLETTPSSTLQLPKGYNIENLEIVIHGICNHCTYSN